MTHSECVFAALAI